MKNIGYAYAIAAALLFGASTPFSKLLLADMSPWILAGILYFGSGLGLALVYFGRKALSPSKEASLKFSDWPWMLGATVFGGILGPVFLMYGLSMTKGSTSALLLNLEAVFTSLIAWVVFKEHFDRRILIGMILIVIGGVILSWQNDMQLEAGLGPLLIALACLSWGIDNNVTRKVSASNPVQVAMVKSLVAGSSNLVLALTVGAALPNVSNFALGSLLGFLGYGLSLTFFVLGLRHIGTSRTGAYFSTSPFVGAGLSILILGENLNIQLVAALIFMAAGVWLHLTESHLHEHEHEELEHEHKHIHDEHHKHEHNSNDPPGEPHSHRHKHGKLRHSHPHYPDIHHRHGHS